MTKEDLYSKLEEEFELIHDNHEYMKMFQTEDAEIAQIARFENVLLHGDVCYWVKLWEDDTKKAIKEYCEKRYSETANEHLKAKYGWALWAIDGKRDYQLLNSTLEFYINILESYVSIEDREYASTFCHYYKRIYPRCCKTGKDGAMMALIDEVMTSENEPLQYDVLSMVYYQEQEDEYIKEKREGYEKKEQLHFLKKMDAHILAKKCLELAASETKDSKYEQLTKWAVSFAGKAYDKALARIEERATVRYANEKMGDYKMEHLFEDDEKNAAIAHLNDGLLSEAMWCYHVAGKKDKEKSAIRAFEYNQPKLRYIPIQSTMPVERRNAQIEFMNSYVSSVLNEGTDAIWKALMGNGLDVFISLRYLKDKAYSEQNDFLFKDSFDAVDKDSFQNSRRTTHEKRDYKMMASSAYKNMGFHIYILLITNGLKEKTLSYELLRDKLLENGFGIELNKTDGLGNIIGSTYLERVEKGLKDFLDLAEKYIEKKDVDWRYCLTFLSTQFEGLFRDVVKKLGGISVKVKGPKDTELIPLEGMLESDEAKAVFSDEDLLLFRHVFTKDGYNIRNDIAHGMLLPQEYTAMKTMLVFLCVLRLTKGTRVLIGLEERHMGAH